MQQHALEGHSDDIQRRLAMLLGSEIGNIRTTTDRRISVIDVARAITGHAADYASQAVRNVSDQYPEVREKITDFKFPGRGQRNTPVTDVRGIVQNLEVPPTERSYRERGAAAICI